MEAAFPQLAFNQWLSRNLQNLVAAVVSESAAATRVGPTAEEQR